MTRKLLYYNIMVLFQCFRSQARLLPLLLPQLGRREQGSKIKLFIQLKMGKNQTLTSFQTLCNIFYFTTHVGVAFRELFVNPVSSDS